VYPKKPTGFFGYAPGCLDPVTSNQSINKIKVEDWCTDWGPLHGCSSPSCHIEPARVKPL